MPEYLAPGVYVEEIEIGAKPIEGVSTSTAAFLGIAEKGPLNEPILITNPGDFTRTFGGYIKILIKQAKRQRPSTVSERVN
jgi:phage tail sheath protein FI